ncbi:hypothetical protein E4K64_14700 [Bradyrhizobium frederickii]|uniref:Uncharacterized protein n=1 Tax=Bradyrhizobium frederickii TaxID=2560054 RepID=A0A4Y9PAX6_9BRAD|nr:hypothetical protein [Bradyrhizobium frederickii]TFV75833.1 hypothetical protein E4K64_14700 [Bradyrhizobium frederickii]
MGEIIRFISNSDRERERLIRQARANYDSIFPAEDLAIGGQRDTSLATHGFGGADPRHGGVSS